MELNRNYLLQMNLMGIHDGAAILNPPGTRRVHAVFPACARRNHGVLVELSTIVYNSCEIAQICII